MNSKVTLVWVGDHVCPFVAGYPYPAEVLSAHGADIVVDVLGTGSGQFIVNAKVVAVDGDRVTVAMP